MIKTNQIVAALCLICALPALVHGQVLEECFWECGVEYCDYLDDYCNYDCHEVCYPILKKSPTPFEESSTLVQDSPNSPLTSSHLNNEPRKSSLVSEQYGQLHANLNRQQVTDQVKLDASRIGKTIKMRLENPAYETVRRGKVVLTRGSPPRGFAMFQDCLSGNASRKVSDAPIRSNKTDATRSSGRRTE